MLDSKTIFWRSKIFIITFPLLTSCYQYIKIKEFLTVKNPSILPTIPATTMEVKYLNPLTMNSTTMTHGVSYPTSLPDPESGYLDFYNAGYVRSCPGNAIDYTFEITNTGAADLVKTQTLAAEVEKTTDYTSGTYGGVVSAAQVFTITQQPNLPLPATATTTVVITLNTSYLCRFSGISAGYGTSYESARLHLFTNDQNHPNYYIDLNMYGHS